MTAPVALIDLDRLLSRAERETALLDRCLPLNLAAEIERVASSWETSGASQFAWQYRPRAALGPLREALGQVVEGAPGACPLGALYAARALELSREVAIVEAIGTKAFRERAAARFPAEDSQTARAAEVRAREWVAALPTETGPRIPAADARDPRSLVAVTERLIGSLRLPIRVVLTDRLASAAATGDGLIAVRSDLSHRESVARRIALHEIHGHALPRVRAKKEALGLFAVGTAEGPDDEEGRAVLIEERHGLLDDARRHELGLRHLAALAVRRGASPVDAIRILLGYGVSVRRAVAIVARVARGGGLARELVYLHALHRVRAAFAKDPAAEAWLERGRIGVAAVPELTALVST